MLKASGRAHVRTPARQSNRYTWASRGFALPAVVIIVLLTYVPFLVTTIISFTDWGGLGMPTFVGLQNYIDLFTDPTFWSAAGNTLMWVVGTIAVPVTLGLVIATLTYNSRFGTWLRLPYLIPYAISGVATGIMWGFVLQSGGALSQALSAMGLTGLASTRWLAAAPLNTILMILCSAWQGAGVNALLFVVGLQSIPKEPLEAARIDGAGGFRIFRSMLWPMLRPITTVVIGLSIVGSLKTFDIVWLMTKGGPGTSSQTLAVTMYKDTFVTGAYGLGSAVAVVLTVVTMVAAFAYIRGQVKAVKEL